MRKPTFSGTSMGLTWSPANAGFIRSDGLITEIDVHQLLSGDPDDASLAPPFTDLAEAGVKPVLTAPADCDPAVLRAVGRARGRLNARALVHACPVPGADTAELDLLVERLRTAQDLVPLPLVIDVIPNPAQDQTEMVLVLREICERVWCTFVLDLTAALEMATLRGFEPEPLIANLPPSRVAYVRVHSSTAHPVSSSTRELVVSTMSRWIGAPPPIVLRSDRPVSSQVRELSDLLSLSGHLEEPSDWPPAELMLRASHAGQSRS